MKNKIIKTEYHQFPKLPDSFITWKYKFEYYGDGKVLFKGLWF